MKSVDVAVIGGGDSGLLCGPESDALEFVCRAD